MLLLLTILLLNIILTMHFCQIKTLGNLAFFLTGGLFPDRTSEFGCGKQRERLFTCVTVAECSGDHAVHCPGRGFHDPLGDQNYFQSEIRKQDFFKYF